MVGSRRRIIRRENAVRDYSTHSSWQLAKLCRYSLLKTTHRPVSTGGRRRTTVRLSSARRRSDDALQVHGNLHAAISESDDQDAEETGSAADGRRVVDKDAAQDSWRGRREGRTIAGNRTER